MTTMVYVIIQYDEYWDGKKVLEVHDNIQYARINIELWEKHNKEHQLTYTSANCKTKEQKPQLKRSQS